MTAPTPRLTLIEPYAHEVGGHYRHTLHALADTAPGSTIITPAHTAGWLAWLLTGCAATVRVLARLSGWVLASRRWPDRVRRIPHQFGLLQRCLVEAACLRTVVRDSWGGAVVILTASEGLHPLAAVLGGCAHLRFVHEVNTTEDLPLRLLGRLAGRGPTRVGVLCPTKAVQQQVIARFPQLTTMVRTYAVDDGDRLTDTEMTSARAVFGIPDTATVVCLVGGWWSHKNIPVVDGALSRLRAPLHVLIAGHPVDQQVLARWRRLPSVQVHVEPGSVPERVLRQVYAAADASLIARRPGVGKESGLVLGAVRLGVPLIVSDHDPNLTRQLDGQPWVRLFPATDPAGLAVLLEQLTDRPLPRPPISAPKDLGMPTAAEQAVFLRATFDEIFRR